jgi:putative phosphoserine phosphatase/1-acylglycerol-3-phosphate O-acyltransferase
MDQILENKEFQKKLKELASITGQSEDQINREAGEYLKELYTEQKPLVNAVLMQISQYVLQRAYDDHIDVNPTEIKNLSKLMRRHPVAFVMTHKTYIDMMVLGAVLIRHGLELPYTFAGINMSFLGLGELGRKSGVIFIRRSFKDNHVYKATLKHFVSHLVDEKSHFMWAIEGTRSRTGKLVWPQMGILKYIAEGEEQSSQEVKYVPVSVVYDLIPDVEDMTEEGRGKNKNPESLMWFLNYLKNMSGNLGKISLRIGEPVERSADQLASIPLEEDTLLNRRRYSLPKFAFELVHNINQITPVTTSSLVCTILLSKFAASKLEVEKDVIALMELIENIQPDALVDRGLSTGECVQNAINLLIQGNLIQQLGTGVKAKYSIVTRNYLSATYYSNMAVHQLYHRAFIEMALLKVANKKSDRLNAFWTEIMDLRDLFKFEFFYSNKSEFSDEIEQNLKFIDEKWEEKLINTSSDLTRLLKRQQIYVARVVLYTYLEAYGVVAETLLSVDQDAYEDENSLLNACVFTGEEMHWLGKIHRVESVSKPFLKNGIRLAKNKGLIPTADKPKKREINGFIKLLKEHSERIKKLQSFTQKPKTQQEQAKVIPLERNVVPGTKSEAVATDVIHADDGPHIAAFFDLDRTIIKGFSAKDFFQARLMSGKMMPREMAAQFSGIMVYAIGNKNFAGLAATSAQGVKGIPEKTFIELGEEVYLKHLAEAIYPESRALVAAHMAKGHTVAIISAATPYQVNPVARDLGIEHVMCTRMEVKKGKFTGKIIEPPCWGEGKYMAAKELSEKLNLDMTKSYFYTDSHEDLPLMEMVGHPRPINPDNELSEIALKNDWPILRFQDEIQPGVSNIIRTALTMGSFIPAAMSGVASAMLTGSRRDGVNSMISTIGELGTKMAGIKMVVHGEDNLWSHRPAVIIFNHQSNADFFIVAKLLKKDTVAVAKKELKSSPIGPLLSAAGVVFLDRTNREKAIEALKPAVDTLKNGISVAIAPEGTRSYDYNLGPFKKGAFHLAMQAGVPIVPIVVKNAHDVMPRGRNLVRPSVVEVVVLNPISVKGWTKENMNDKISEVRGLYIKELQQEELDDIS